MRIFAEIGGEDVVAALVGLHSEHRARQRLDYLSL
jgi:hypothetical protein